MRDLKAGSLGFRTSGLRRVPLPTALTGIRDAGFGSVEFCLEHPDVAAVATDHGRVAALIESARCTGLEVCSVSFHGKSDPPVVRRTLLTAAAKAARLAGVPLVVAGSPSADASPGFTPGSLARELEAVLDAGAGKVVLAVEPEPGTRVSSLEDWFALDGLLGGAIAINLDLGHLFLTEPSFSRALARSIPRTASVHIDDVLAGRHSHLVPGYGGIPWGEVRAALASCRGPLVVDLFRLPSNPWALVRSALAGAIEMLTEGDLCSPSASD